MMGLQSRPIEIREIRTMDIHVRGTSVFEFEGAELIGCRFLLITSMLLILLFINIVYTAKIKSTEKENTINVYENKELQFTFTSF